MTTVGIFGLGLIGASIAKSLKRKPGYNILGFDMNNDVLISALADHTIDIACNEMANSVNCDIIIFATPPATTPSLINSCKYKNGALVCDMCGVKSFIEDIRDDIDFVGMHPMAGKEKSGYESSGATLFDGANLLLIKRSSTSKSACKMAEELGNHMGFGVLKWTDPKTHDELISFTSQMPHLLSAIIVSHPFYDKCHNFEGGSLNDFTRIARLDAPMWTALFKANSSNLKDQCNYYIDAIARFRDMLGDEDSMEAYLQNARDRRISHERID